MSGYSFDTNIVIDVLQGIPAGIAELRRARAEAGGVWVSRMVWIEVMSKGAVHQLRDMEAFLAGFATDDIDQQTAARAAALRREKPRLRSPDAIVLASAQLRGRILVTRNTKDFPANMPGIRVPYTL